MDGKNQIFSSTRKPSKAFSSVLKGNGTHYNCVKEGCGRVLNSVSSLKDHMRSHSSARTYSCPVQGCGATFKYRSGRSNHQRTKHVADKTEIKGTRKAGKRKTGKCLHSSSKINRGVCLQIQKHTKMVDTLESGMIK